ncbi:hypothetical protein SAMN04488063_2056 [Halopelagius inordinatus]|uniref:Polyketide cyclase / dehydrase and lipid transport n=1 Tax=Halopelagius inordinatus TaxID=553467 RepID=A0A1I2RU44_9EURY|nr:hypothetical protein [Halopelagius inordinatus]SFG44068.1 hypothetical protein SAMN04488063_2056 [Halopelagius inordinatus]
MELPFDKRARRFVLGVLGAATVQSWLRAWHRRWLATADERDDSLPGDDVVPDANLVRTHAVTVDAPREAVWPWLVRMCTDRTELSGDELRGDDEGTETLLPDARLPTVGDAVPALPSGDDGFVVSVLDPQRSLVLASMADAFGRREAEPGESSRWFWRTSWAFRLSEPASGRTRLVVRVRVSYGPKLLAPVAHLVAFPLHFLAQRRKLLEIKSSAESLASEWGDDERQRHL